MLLNWNESSARGRTVTFLLPEDSEHHPFKEYSVRSGKRAGQRFAAVLVEIDEAENLVAPPQKVSQVAAALCKDSLFQHWADERSFDTINNETAARAFILTLCGVDSRADLDRNVVARTVFEVNVLDPFNRYRNLVTSV